MRPQPAGTDIEIDLMLLEVAPGADLAIESMNGDAIPPGSSGLDLLEVFGVFRHDIPIIVLTVLDRLTDEIASVQRGRQRVPPQAGEHQLAHSACAQPSPQRQADRRRPASQIFELRITAHIG
jgi:hypothetical protein